MPSAATKFVDFMTIYPQQCIVSGYPNERNQKQALDLGFDIPEYGRAYVSDLGMAWLSRQFGYVHQDAVDVQLAELAEENDRLKIRVKELEASVSRIPETVEGILDGLKSLSISAVNDLLNITGSPAVDSTESAQDDAENDGATSKAAGRNSKAASK
jgi:hypothetical protein